MTRRRDARARGARDDGHRPEPGSRAPAAGGRGGNRAQGLRAARVPALALLPLRAFFGVTFLYAGLDKLVSPAFLRTGDPASIVAQLEVFARTSPLGGLMRLAMPIAPEIGLLIALAEIGIGLGALTGLAFRLAALGGAALSLLLWLTASWATRPYYYGPDLPYLAGWLVLALAGHGDLLVVRWLVERRPGAAGEFLVAGRRRARDDAIPRSLERRLIIQAGLLGVLTALVASAGAPLRLIVERSNQGVGTGSTPPPMPTAAPVSGIPVARVADVEVAGSAAFRVPFSAPAPLPAGDPAVLVRLPDGTFVAFDAVCTHAGCTVEWDAADRILICPCHGAAFDPAADGAVLGGPTEIPLAALPLVIDPASGTILLRT